MSVHSEALMTWPA